LMISQHFIRIKSGSNQNSAYQKHVYLLIEIISISLDKYSRYSVWLLYQCTSAINCLYESG
jgi:hypothetical protein